MTLGARIEGARSRAWPALALVAYCGLFLFETLSPFDFRWSGLTGGARALRPVEWVPFTRACPAHPIFCPWDPTINVLAFLPVGALGAAASRLAAGWRRTARVTAWAFALSLAVETAQVFLITRFPSTGDVLTNTVGAFIGAHATVWWRDARARWTERQTARRRQIDRRPGAADEQRRARQEGTALEAREPVRADPPA